MDYDAQRALDLLRAGVGQGDAEFREGQEDAIRHIVEGRGRLLVVQKTGWGKSFVYFIATKLLREAGLGPTLLFSPLLSLMRNQIAAAERMGVRAIRITSDNREHWAAAEEQLMNDEADILLISPERLGNERFRIEVLAGVAERVALLVIDEAHCISDWGHDFRPHYRLIERIAHTLPANLRLLATTATANDRVMDDLRGVLGPNLDVLRGDLNRPSLLLQTIRLPRQSERLAWLAEHVPLLPGHGIIYALTVRDANQVAEWLQSRGIDVEAYTGQTGERREELEHALLGNRVKALAATNCSRDGLRQARPRLRDSLPEPRLRGGLLPAGGTCRPRAGQGLRGVAERRGRCPNRRLLHRQRISDTRRGPAGARSARVCTGRPVRAEPAC